MEEQDQNQMNLSVLSTVIDRQNDLAELIVTQQNLSLLPTRDISVFDGSFSLDWIRFPKIENVECGEETC